MFHWQIKSRFPFQSYNNLGERDREQGGRYVCEVSTSGYWAWGVGGYTCTFSECVYYSVSRASLAEVRERMSAPLAKGADGTGWMGCRTLRRPWLAEIYHFSGVIWIQLGDGQSTGGDRRHATGSRYKRHILYKFFCAPSLPCLQFKGSTYRSFDIIQWGINVANSSTTKNIERKTDRYKIHKNLPQSIINLN